MIEIFLEKQGFQVVTANDGVEGINKAYAELPNLIISDIIMPELNGYQLCRLLKNEEFTLHIPIILLTNLGQSQDKFWGIRAGADSYICKEADPRELLNQVNVLLKKKNNTFISSQEKEAKNYQNREGRMIHNKVNILLDKMLFDAILTGEIRKLANFVYSREKLVKEYFDLLRGVVDCCALAMIIFNDFKTNIMLNLTDILPDNELEKVKNFLMSRVKTVSERQEPQWEITDNGKKGEPAGDTVKTLISVPIKHQDELLGELALFSFDQNAFENNKRTLELLTGDFSTLLDLLLLYEKNRLLSITDGLTKVYNHRHFFEVLENEWLRYQRYKTPLSLLMVDVDHFKNINDVYGHQLGDVVLAGIAKAMVMNTRELDTVARYGGEEFAVILPQSGLDQAENVAEKLRQEVERHHFHEQLKSKEITISIGIAVASSEMNTISDLIASADAALYSAKEQGRNRVVIAKT
jgi:two-component system cell cycle response regulator